MPTFKSNILISICKKPKTLGELSNFLKVSKPSLYIYLEKLIENDLMKKTKIKNIIYYYTPLEKYKQADEFIAEFKKMVG